MVARLPADSPIVAALAVSATCPTGIVSIKSIEGATKRLASDGPPWSGRESYRARLTLPATFRSLLAVVSPRRRHPALSAEFTTSKRKPASDDSQDSYDGDNNGNGGSGASSRPTSNAYASRPGSTSSQPRTSRKYHCSLASPLSRLSQCARSTGRSRRAASGSPTAGSGTSTTQR